MLLFFQIFFLLLIIHYFYLKYNTFQNKVVYFTKRQIRKFLFHKSFKQNQIKNRSLMFSIILILPSIVCCDSTTVFVESISFFEKIYIALTNLQNEIIYLLFCILLVEWLIYFINGGWKHRNRILYKIYSIIQNLDLIEISNELILLIKNKWGRSGFLSKMLVFTVSSDKNFGGRNGNTFGGGGPEMPSWLKKLIKFLTGNKSSASDKSLVLTYSDPNTSLPSASPDPSGNGLPMGLIIATITFVIFGGGYLCMKFFCKKRPPEEDPKE